MPREMAARLFARDSLRDSPNIERGSEAAMTNSARHKRVTVRLAIVLLCIHSGLLGWGTSRHSFTWAEVGLLSAGIIHWRTGRFDVYRASPPLVGMGSDYHRLRSES